MERLVDPRETLHVSFASAWEYGIKRLKHAHAVAVEFDRLLLPSYVLLGVDFGVYRYAETLPQIHRDPFDRILIAQALDLRFTLVTSDETIRRYPVPTLW